VKAVRVEQIGGPEVLRLADVERPAPGPDDVLVRQTAAGLNYIDVYVRTGLYPRALPFVPGREGAGIVEAVGSNVTAFRPGMSVAYAESPGLGGYAELVAVPMRFCVEIPEGIPDDVACAAMLQGMTAHYLIHEYRCPKPGDVVLIHAAAGGMGLLLVQWARRLGARVIGTVSTEEKAEAARNAGASDVILYTKQDFVAEIKRLTSGHGADLIIDGVGKTTFAGNLEAAALRGNIVIYGMASGPADPIVPNSLMTRALTISGGSLPNYLLTREELLRRAGDVLEGIREGWLRLRIDRILPLAQAAEAHRLFENRQTIGKVLLSVSNH